MIETAGTADAVDAICAGQSEGGAFLSMVRQPFGDVSDRNCFVTALVLRELSASAVLPPRLVDARRRALGFLTRATNPQCRCSFGFYPHRRQPFWLPEPLPADADDTALAALELVKGGIWPREALTIIADEWLSRHRAELRHCTATFHRPGVFLTWFAPPEFANIIDVCVNVNVLAMLAFSNQKNRPGYAEAIDMVNAAVGAAAQEPALLPQLAPFYPSSRELLAALRHAVAAGVDLGAACVALDGIVDDDNDDDNAVCANVAGDIVWRAPVLRHVRRWRHQSEPGERT